MPKQLRLIIGLLAVATLIGVFVFLNGKQSQSSPAPEPLSSSSSPEEAQQTSKTMSKGSIRNLLLAGKSVSCVVDYGSGGTKGTTYVSGNKVRADFTIQVPDNQETDSHMIQSDDTAYIWSSANPKGTKFTIDKTQASVTPAADSQNMNLDQEVDMDCSDWSVDQSVFVPPTNVEFVDLSAMMNQGKVEANPTSGTQKSVCDAISDPTAKAACEQAMSGN